MSQPAFLGDEPRDDDRVITNSELDDFRRCRRLHWLRHVRKLAPIAPPNPLKASEVGLRVHDELRDYYTERRTADEITRNLAAEWMAAEDGAPGTDFAKAAELVLAIVEGYFDWLAETGDDQGRTLVGAELPVYRRLEGVDRVVMAGKLDALFDDRDFGLVPADWKTTGYALSVRIPYLKRATQPTHYLWLLQPIWPLRTLLLGILRQSKRSEKSVGPYYVREPVTRNTEQLAAYEGHLREWVAGILAADARTDVPPPSPGEDCSWRCPFYRVCESFDNGDDVEDDLSNEYQEHDPMARYREEDA